MIQLLPISPNKYSKQAWLICWGSLNFSVIISDFIWKDLSWSENFPQLYNGWKIVEQLILKLGQRKINWRIRHRWRLNNLAVPSLNPPPTFNQLHLVWAGAATCIQHKCLRRYLFSTRCHLANFSSGRVKIRLIRREIVVAWEKKGPKANWHRRTYLMVRSGIFRESIFGWRMGKN